PAGIQVGKIVETGLASGESFLDLKIELSTNFSNLHHVYVVKDLLVDEKERLETDSQDKGSCNINKYCAADRDGRAARCLVDEHRLLGCGDGVRISVLSVPLTARIGEAS